MVKLRAVRPGAYNPTRFVLGLLMVSLVFPFGTCAAPAQKASNIRKGLASWYGEAHRGKLMANGKKFDPDKLTAASWFYPLGTKVKVVTNAPNGSRRSVLVTITDRGPAQRYVEEGRIIDLGHAAFKRLAHPDIGLVPVSVLPVGGS